MVQSAPGESRARREMLDRLRGAAARDARIVGLVDYGSSSEGRADGWSDVDAALFIRDDAFDDFARGWKSWAGQFGTLLLAYVGGVGHPWAVYDAEPAPLRVDFNFWRASEIETVLTWPNSPTAVEAFVRYDATGGALTAHARQLVGRWLGPPDAAATFESVCGDFWYYLLRADVRLRRGESWATRFDYNAIVLGNLLGLLRLEAGALGRWRAAGAAAGIERVLSPLRLPQLDACVPGPTDADLARALRRAARLGRQVCAAIAAREGWPWPEALAEKTLRVLRADDGRAREATEQTPPYDVGHMIAPRLAEPYYATDESGDGTAEQRLMRE